MSEVKKSSSRGEVFTPSLSSESESDPVSEMARKSILSGEAELEPGRVNPSIPVGTRVTTARTSAVVHTKGLSATATAKMPPEPVEFKEGVTVTPSAKPHVEPKDRNKLMVSGKAKLVFSTHAMSGKGTSREVELTKEEGKKQVEDTDRQDKVDDQFMDFKHELGLGEHEAKDGSGIVTKYDKKMVNYSITWHFIEIFDEEGNLEKRVDLLDKRELKELLKERGRDDSDTNFEKVYNKLLGINREVKNLTEKEVGKEKKPAFVSDHPYVGNPNGPALFQPASAAWEKMVKDEKKGKYLRTMERLKLVDPEEKKGLFETEPRKLTSNGAKAVNDMRKLSQLHLMLRNNLVQEWKKIDKELTDLKEALPNTEETSPEIKKLEATLHELDGVRGEIDRANRTAMNHALMEYHGTHTIEQRSGDGRSKNTSYKTGEALLQTDSKFQLHLLKQSRNDLVGNVTKENKSFFTRKDYEVTNEDQKSATETALLLNHLKKPTQSRRLDQIEVSQDLGRTVYRDPRAEVFLLNGVLNRGTTDLRSFEGVRSDRVKGVLKGTLQGFHGKVTQFEVRTDERGKPKEAGELAITALDHVTYGEKQVKARNTKALWRSSSSGKED